MDITIFPFLFLLLIIFLFKDNPTFYESYPQIDHSVEARYQDWKTQFDIHFSDEEDHYRLHVFALNLVRIDSHNRQSDTSFLLGLNQFAYLTEEEFTEIVLKKSPSNRFNLLHQPQINLSYINLSRMTDIDWQTLGKISEVKNQGNCNSGYAFSTTGLIETSLMMQNQNYLLSEQQIIDCAIEYGSFGCEGGSREGALRYSMQKGLDIEMQYPYTGSKGICRSQKGTILPDFTLAEAIGCDQIRQRLYKSPLTVAVNAKNWQLYSTGIFNNCPSTSEVNHETLLVGVTISYWRLKNSWGSRWGQSGYIRVKLGDNCGICQKPGYGFSIQIQVL